MGGNGSEFGFYGFAKSAPRYPVILVEPMHVDDEQLGVWLVCDKFETLLDGSLIPIIQRIPNGDENIHN